MRRLNPSGECHWYGSKDAFGRPCVNIALTRARAFGQPLRTRHLGAGNVGVIRPRTDISQELDPFIRNPSRWSRPEEWTMVDGAGLPAPVIRKSPPDIGLWPSVQMVLRLRLRHHPAKGRQRRRINLRLRTKADALAPRRKKPSSSDGGRRPRTPQGRKPASSDKGGNPCTRPGGNQHLRELKETRATRADGNRRLREPAETRATPWQKPTPSGVGGNQSNPCGRKPAPSGAGGNPYNPREARTHCPRTALEDPAR
jgi:hypothetical protein